MRVRYRNYCALITITIIVIVCLVVPTLQSYTASLEEGDSCLVKNSLINEGSNYYSRVSVFVLFQKIIRSNMYWGIRKRVAGYRQIVNTVTHYNVLGFVIRSIVPIFLGIGYDFKYLYCAFLFIIGISASYFICVAKEN